MSRSAPPRPQILIVEPNQQLDRPYRFLPASYTTTRLSSIPIALKHLGEHTPDLVLLSASYPPSETLILLEALKDISQDQTIPVFIIVDLSNRLSHVLGTTWGGRVAIIDCYATKTEFQTLLLRLIPGRNVARPQT